PHLRIRRCQRLREPPDLVIRRRSIRLVFARYEPCYPSRSRTLTSVFTWVVVRVLGRQGSAMGCRGSGRGVPGTRIVWLGGPAGGLSLAARGAGSPGRPGAGLVGHRVVVASAAQRERPQPGER